MIVMRKTDSKLLLRGELIEGSGNGAEMRLNGEDLELEGELVEGVREFEEGVSL